MTLLLSGFSERVMTATCRYIYICKNVHLCLPEGRYLFSFHIT